MAELLLLEPDHILADTFQRSLELQGHTVRWTAQAQLAIDLADQQRPDLIVLELQLADHGGIEFLYELRSYPEWQTIPVVIHSLVPPKLLAVSDTQLQKLGIISYLYKPSTSLKKLNQTINQALPLTPA